MIVFRVDDMSCSHCVGVVTRALKAADPNAAVIEDAGYTLVVVGG